MMDRQTRRRKITIPQLQRKMREDEGIVQLAVYDYRNAVIADRLGVDILCVSDTGGMILFGHKSTVSVTFEEVLQNVQQRDYIDTHREDSPLVKANDAIEIDNSAMTKKEQFELVMRLVNEKLSV